MLRSIRSILFFPTLRQRTIYRYNVQRLQEILGEVDEIYETGKHSRKGTLNYSPDDVKYLLDLAADVELLGRNHWALVVEKLKQWAETDDRAPRTLDSLKDKFDKLAYTRKKTGDPTINLEVRRAKRIYQYIQAKAQAKALGNDNKNLALSHEQMKRAVHTTGVLGQRRKRRMWNDCRLPLAKRMHVDIGKHMKIMTTTMIEVANCVKHVVHNESSVVQLPMIEELIQNETSRALRSSFRELVLPAHRAGTISPTEPLPSIEEMKNSNDENEYIDGSGSEM